MNAYSREFFQPESRLQAGRAPENATGDPASPGQVRLHRTIFISDTHLGTRGCKAQILADFLAHNDCHTLYLVGDIIDGWQFRNWYWDEAHRNVLDAILFKAAHGTRVIYIPGNHDEDLRA